jgi:hypothetical protein
MSKIFPLPEMNCEAFFSLLTNAIYLRWPSGVARKLVKVTYVQHKTQDYTFELTFAACATRRASFTMPMNRAVEFGFWLNWFGCPAMPDEAPVAATPAPTSCPVCYGTGFHKGFGAPCSQGCSS